jgi:hypothetical protein
LQKYMMIIVYTHPKDFFIKARFATTAGGDKKKEREDQKEIQNRVHVCLTHA